MTEDQLLEHLRSLIPMHGSQAQLARAFGVSRQTLCDVLAKRRIPTPAILSSLRLRRVVVYEKT